MTKKAVKQPKCFSCGTPCDPTDDLCAGCGHIVCVKCALEFRHDGVNGAHGKCDKKSVKNK